MRVILHLCAVLLGHSLPIFVLPPHPLTPFFTGLHALAIRTLGSRVGVVSHLDARFLPQGGVQSLRKPTFSPQPKVVAFQWGRPLSIMRQGQSERVMSLGMAMALALLVYALGEWELRRKLLENQASLPDQKGKPTQRPTLRWVFQLFMWVRLVVLEGRPRVLNLAPHHETAVRLLGAQRYYLLE